MEQISTEYSRAYSSLHLSGAFFDLAFADRMTAYIKEHGEIDAAGFKDLTGLTRKFSIPLLEYFDKIKLTIRIGDKRVLRKK